MNELEQNLLFAVVGLSLVTSLVVILMQAVRRRRGGSDGGNPWDDLGK